MKPFWSSKSPKIATALAVAYTFIQVGCHMPSACCVQLSRERNNTPGCSSALAASHLMMCNTAHLLMTCLARASSLLPTCIMHA